ncbi:hypothetical protein DN068_00670 [Taibaiella soli]|uniref:RloB domain-containing protein n=1 Tax=Taibaiella soli TaxID=1649169 RepID=A0A2W2B382_9BACT|nr:hypothetical protein DN068_00670 [Taibaiella soli]
MQTLVAEGYDKVFWIIDMDVIVDQKKQLNTFLEYKANCPANVVVIMNHPCLEYWLLCHFEYCNAPFRKCGEAGKRLEHYLTGYEKSEKFYKRPDNDIYKRLKGELDKARERSKDKEFNPDSPFQGFSQMHKLFDELLPKI